MRQLALALLMGALIGFLAGAVLEPFTAGGGSLQPAEDRSRGLVERPPGEDAADGPMAPPASRQAAPSPSGPAEPRVEAGLPAAAGRFSAALLAHHPEHFELGWKTLRSDAPSSGEAAEGEREFRERTLALSHRLGVDAAEARIESERVSLAHEGADAAILLAAMKNGSWVPTPDFVASDTFDELTRSRGGSGAVDGQAFAQSGGKTLSKGLTISFGPGVHELDERLFSAAEGDAIATDVTVLGAGQNAILLRIGNISARGNVERLTFRNLTLDAENAGLFDLRTGNASLHLERVRVVRFDAGHGGCSIFFVSAGCAVSADDSEFVGGYGRSPGNGNPVRSAPFLGRFARCRFELIDRLRTTGVSSGLARFEGCTFELHRGDPRDATSDRVQFVNCFLHAARGERAG